ncbi:HBR415Cp [Eremothecium sinecaudum]|uniref:HBR415Cp n=1 Tax=Eremothecium sinecaudum TaxID=45286 RepID=A0A109UXF5_9SACH|nr:HBR415Cp [Eremothecium sinecaudum]AMD19316.1 HBR415Cp [Eremothecium sinecaudum]
MSFAGTLIISAISGAIYKYGGQEFQPIEEVPMGFRELTVGFVQDRILLLTSRATNIATNATPDFFRGQVYRYPIRAFIRSFTTRRYLFMNFTTFLFYIVSYLLITVVYFLTIFPIYLGLSVILGPAGIAIAWVHMLLHTNNLTMMVLRMTQVSRYSLRNALKINGNIEVLEDPPVPVKLFYPVDTPYFWMNHFPWKTVEYTAGATVMGILLLISAIPVIGPVLFNILIAPFVTRIYLAKYLRLKGFNNLQREERFYDNFGQYLAFGLVASCLEIVPILAGVTFATNNVAIALWDPEKEPSFLEENEEDEEEDMSIEEDEDDDELEEEDDDEMDDEDMEDDDDNDIESDLMKHEYPMDDRP